MKKILTILMVFNVFFCNLLEASVAYSETERTQVISVFEGVLNYD